MELTSALDDALEAAFAVYDVEGEKRLRARYDLTRSRHVTIRDGRRYDADLLGHLVLSQADPRLSPLATESLASLVLSTGRAVIPVSDWKVDHKRAWRFNVWDSLKGMNVNARWLQDRGVYRGGSGVWYDAEPTRSLAPDGVAVGVLHTGRHYPDDIDDKMAIYYYPRTARPPARDRNEIEAVKNAGELHLPIFLISEGPGGTRSVRLAWVVAADDEAEVFLLEFAETEPRHLDMAEPSTPFALKARRRRARATGERYARNPEFKFRVLHRHGGRCAVTGVGVPVVLDAAHVVPVNDGGSDDERNGLLLTATLHRAFDADLWAIEPTTLALRTRNRGPTLQDLQVDARTLRLDTRPPHLDALSWRWARFKKEDRTEAVSAEVAAVRT